MRPPPDDMPVRILVHRIPRFEDHYLDLLDIYDDDLTPEIVFMELADVVSDLACTRRDDEMLEAALEAVEDVVEESAEHAELVGRCFLDQLSELTVERVRPLFKRRTSELLSLGEKAAEGRAQPLSFAGNALSTASMHR